MTAASRKSILTVLCSSLLPLNVAALCVCHISPLTLFLPMFANDCRPAYPLSLLRDVKLFCQFPTLSRLTAFACFAFLVCFNPLGPSFCYSVPHRNIAVPTAPTFHVSPSFPLPFSQRDIFFGPQDNPIPASYPPHLHVIPRPAFLRRHRPYSPFLSLPSLPSRDKVKLMCLFPIPRCYNFFAMLSRR